MISDHSGYLLPDKKQECFQSSLSLMTQTRHKFQSGKSVRTAIVRVKKPNLHFALMNCVFLTVMSIGPQMLAVLAV